MKPSDKRRLRHMVREGKEVSVMAITLGYSVQQIKRAMEQKS